MKKTFKGFSEKESQNIHAMIDDIMNDIVEEEEEQREAARARGEEIPDDEDIDLATYNPDEPINELEATALDLRAKMESGELETYNHKQLVDAYMSLVKINETARSVRTTRVMVIKKKDREIKQMIEFGVNTALQFTAKERQQIEANLGIKKKDDTDVESTEDK